MGFGIFLISRTNPTIISPCPDVGLALHLLPIRSSPLNLVYVRPRILALPRMSMQSKALRLWFRDPRHYAHFQYIFARVGAGFGFDRASHIVSSRLVYSIWRWRKGQDARHTSHQHYKNSDTPDSPSPSLYPRRYSRFHPCPQ